MQSANLPCKSFVDKLGALKRAYDNSPGQKTLRLLVATLKGVEGAVEVIPYVFDFLEALPHADLGAPGPLVLFVEEFPSHYEDLLVSSVLRNPVELTVWMCNRALTGKVSPEHRAQLIHALMTVPRNVFATPACKDAAIEFLRLHRA